MWTFLPSETSVCSTWLLCWSPGASFLCDPHLNVNKAANSQDKFSSIFHMMLSSRLTLPLRTSSTLTRTKDSQKLTRATHPHIQVYVGVCVRVTPYTYLTPVTLEHFHISPKAGYGRPVSLFPAQIIVELVWRHDEALSSYVAMLKQGERFEDMLH